MNARTYPSSNVANGGWNLDELSVQLYVLFVLFFVHLLKKKKKRKVFLTFPHVFQQKQLFLWEKRLIWWRMWHFIPNVYSQCIGGVTNLFVLTGRSRLRWNFRWHMSRGRRKKNLCEARRKIYIQIINQSFIAGPHRRTKTNRRLIYLFIHSFLYKKCRRTFINWCKSAHTHAQTLFVESVDTRTQTHTDKELGRWDARLRC